MFPQLSDGRLVTAVDSDSTLDLIAAADVGDVVARAFADIAAFDHQELDLAAESLTFSEIGRVITDVTGSAVTVDHLGAESARAAGSHAGVVESQQWASVEGYRVDLAASASLGVDYRSFARWAREHRAEFSVATR